MTWIARHANCSARRWKRCGFRTCERSRRSDEAHAYRIFYFTVVGKRIVVLHAFEKKTQKTPPHELDIAYKRMADFLSRSQDDDET